MTRRRQNALFFACLLCFSLSLAFRETACAADTSDTTHSPQPIAADYLYSGRLVDGIAAVTLHLKEQPKDDQARFGLAVIQLAQTIERLAGDVQRLGIRQDAGFRVVPMLLPMAEPPTPDQIAMAKAVSYDDLRRTAQQFLDGLATVDQSLAIISDPDVKMPLDVLAIRVQVGGRRWTLRDAFARNLPQAPVGESLMIAFDRGDVEWLRGYCHTLSASCELFLAVDASELFNRAGHLIFLKTDTPYAFLARDYQAGAPVRPFDRPWFSDVVAGVHSLRFPVREPQRMQAALRHLEAMVKHAKAMWKFYEAETDDDREWIPNPQQHSAIGIPVHRETLDAWLAIVDEVDLLLQGKRLLPFWRGNDPRRGVNLRRAFTEPQTIDVIYWVQGTAAAPYLENGQVTELAAPEFLDRINETFGGMGFFGFAAWFN